MGKVSNLRREVFQQGDKQRNFAWLSLPLSAKMMVARMKRDKDTLEVKEYVYQRKDAARKRMLKLLNEQKHEILICTHDNIQHLKPEKYITEHDEDTFHTQ